jgi:hypothetical protein
MLNLANNITITLLKSLFTSYSNITRKVVLTSTNQANITGSSALVFNINSLPSDGNCNIDQTEGFATC